MAHKLMSWFLSFLVFPMLLSPSVSACDGASPRYGNMTKDHDLEVGSTLTIKCTLFTNLISDNSSEYFVTSENLMIKFGNIFLQNLEVIDSYTVQYVVPNATANDTGYYYCFLSIPELTYNPFICTTYVAVGYPPLPVNNFSCISLHLQRLNCSWDKPFNPVKTKYELYDYYPSVIFRRMCPIPRENSCEWRVDTKPPYRQHPMQLKFMLVANNSLGTKNQFFTIDHFKIVKPPEPQKMILSNITKHSVNVHWIPPKGFEFNNLRTGLEYWLHYCPLMAHFPHLCRVVKLINETSTTVRNLVPYTDYLFSLRCRSSVAESEEMWSPFLNASVRTEPDVPYLAPEMATSSFEVTQNTQDSSRSITLYWEPIPGIYENGKDFQYIISYQLHYRSAPTKREALEFEVGNSTSFTFRNMALQSAYLFRLFAKNSFGTSTNMSVIVVDKESNLLQSPKDISVLSHGQGKYTISWKSAELNFRDSVQQFTLFWCQSIKPRPFSCRGPIKWKSVFGNHHELNLSDYNTNYQFAVSANRDHYVSGLKWASCVVPYRGVMYKINNLDLSPNNSTSIQVKWNLDCKAQKNVIQEYAIIYCPVLVNSTCPSNSSKQLLFKNEMKEQRIVTGLQPFTRYRFVLQARTMDGWSESSDPVLQSTMSAAPSDPPRDVSVVSVTGTIITIRFKTPLIPNGNITRFSVLYSKLNSDSSEPWKENVPAEKSKHVYEKQISSNVAFYTNYSIEVQACVEMACSPHSAPVYAMTEIGTPSSLDPPHTEIVNATLVNVSWKHPPLPNGPIDMYYLTMAWHYPGDEKDMVKEELFNISGNHQFVSLSVTCDQEAPDGLIYFFSVQAVNVKNNVPLFSEPSGVTQTRLCFVNSGGMSLKMLVGLVTGAAIAMTAFVAALYAFVKWIKRKIDMVKGITVQLPTGLDSPIENPLSSYDKFKNGLIKNRDCGVPYEHTYERLFPFAADKFKEIDNSFATPSEEYLKARACREKSGRNQSGDSNMSNKGHDSISSSNTTKTHISIDSGAEMDLPPSPDTAPSNCSSSNTTPRSYKPDLDIVKETNPMSSKDSGLDKESFNQTGPIICEKPLGMSPRYLGYDKTQYQSYFKANTSEKAIRYEPYSKFAIIAPAFSPNYISLDHQSRSLLKQQALANSEPSVNEFEEDYSQLLAPGAPPYCKFGLARSASNVLDLAYHVLPVQPNLGYSKFGILYGALGKSSQYRKVPKSLGQGQKLQTQLKLRNQNPFVLTKDPSVAVPILENELSKLEDSTISHKEHRANVTFSEVATILGSPETQVAVGKRQCDDNPTCDRNSSTNNDKHIVSNGYVSFNHAVNVPTVHCKPMDTIHRSSPVLSGNMEDSTAVLSTSPENRNATPSPITMSSKPSSGYVSFQDAKVIQLNGQRENGGNVSPETVLVDTPVSPEKPDNESACLSQCDAIHDLVLGVCDSQTNVISASEDRASPVIHFDHPNALNSTMDYDVGSLNMTHAQISNNIPSDGEEDDGFQDDNCESSINEAPICNPPVAPSNGYVAWNELLTGERPTANGTTKVVTLPNVVSKLYVQHV